MAENIVLVGGIDSKQGSETATTRQTSHVYRVRDLADQQLTEYEILQFTTEDPEALRLPFPDEPHPETNDMIVTRRSAIPVVGEEGRVWDVTITYEGIGPYDPVTDLPRVKYGLNQYTLVADRAWQLTGEVYTQDLPILNSAGDPFDPPIQEQESRLHINIVMNFFNATSGFLVSRVLEFQNSLNTATSVKRIAGVDVEPFQAKMLKIEPLPIIRSNGVLDGKPQFQVSWQVTFDIEIMPSGKTYEREILNAGYYYLPGGSSGAKKTQFTKPTRDEESVPVSQPQLLKANGDAATVDEANYLKYITAKPKDWEVLQLPPEPTYAQRPIADIVIDPMALPDNSGGVSGATS